MSAMLVYSKLPWTELATITIGFLISFIIAVIAYRLWFHPLSKYPGPFLARITSWRAGYYTWIGDNHIDTWRLHERHGPLVRIAPNVLSANSATAYDAIYSHDGNVAKADVYSVTRPYAHIPTIVDAKDKPTYSRKRRLLAHLFAPPALASLQERMLTPVRMLCEKLGEGADQGTWGPPCDISAWTRYCTFDIQSSLCFGKSLSMLEKPDNRYILSLITAIGRRNSTCISQPRVRQLKLDIPYILYYLFDLLRYNQWVTDRNKEGVMEGKVTGSPGFFSYIIGAVDPETGSGWGVEEIWAESSVLVVAGADTIVTGIVSTLFYLLHDQSKMDRLLQEIRSTFSDVEEIKMGHLLNSCRYMMACIDEAMRMTPPTSTAPPREVLANGTNIDGNVIPEGCVVGTPIYGLHHNPDVFDDPFVFRPERWLPEENTDEVYKRYKSGYCVYSKGPRSCIGRNQAQLQMPLTLARILFLFDIRITPGTNEGEGNPKARTWGRHRPGEYQVRDWFTAERKGPSVQLKLREM